MIGKRVITIFIVTIVIAIIVTFAISYNNATKENTKFNDFNRHLEDAIDMNKVQ